MATTLPKEPLRALFATLSGLSSDRVIWDGEPKGFAGPGEDGKTGFLILDLIATRKLGTDCEDHDYSNPALTTITYSGQRLRTVTVRAEDYRDYDEGFDLLEDVRVGLGQDDNLLTLSDAGLSLARADDVRTLTISVAGRRLSFATLDVLFNQAISKVVTKTIDQDTYINEVEVTGEDDLAPAGVDDIAGP